MSGFFLILTCLALGVTSAVRLDAELTSLLKKEKDDRTLRTVVLTMKDQHEESTRMLNTVEDRIFNDREHRLETVGQLLKKNSDVSQKNLLDELENLQTRSGLPQVKTESLWLSNQVIVRNADVSLIRMMSKRDDVEYMEEEFFVKIHNPTIVKDEVSLKGANDAVQWGVKNVEAPQVWANNNRGRGIKVGVIDTGALLSHEALKDNYIGTENYGWYDPSNASVDTPTDVQGHGTHCTGSIVGKTRGIGVAPEAKWMSCRGCGSQSCPSSDLMKCGQFMGCPHDTKGKNEKCSLAPHVVSNSWGGMFNFGRGNSSFDPMIKAMRKMGIVVVFAAGNSGPFCNTVGSPGDSAMVLSIGSINNDSKVSDYSSRGPTPFTNVYKPDVVAPGEKIYSASRKGNNTYEEMSGTSMACPHAAGVVALMLASNPNKRFTHDEVYNALTTTAVKAQAKTTTPDCMTYRNQGRKSVIDGFGRILATKAIAALNKS